MRALRSLEPSEARHDTVYRRSCAWNGLVLRDVVRLSKALESADDEAHELRERLREIEGELDRVGRSPRPEDLDPTEGLHGELREVGDVDYGVGSWPPLAFTGVEVERIAALYEHVYGTDSASLAVLRGSEATVDAFARAAAGRSVLHLATHGFFERPGLRSAWAVAQEQTRGGGLAAGAASTVGEDPGLLAGLVLSAGEDGEAGILSAPEVGRLPLASCRLAVLSACETGFGASRSGEGLQSLSRAFLEAGAQSVVGSMWKVEDEATQRLVVRFYEGLWRDGLRAGDALRRARLALLADPAASSHSAWGAFTLTGEWR